MSQPSQFARDRQAAAPAGAAAAPTDQAAPAIAGEGRVLPEGVATAISLAVVWLLVIAASAIDKSSFLSRETVLSVTFTMAVLGVLTVGQSLVTMSGGVLDLSVPTALILPAWVIATMLSGGISGWLAVVVGLAVGTAWGFFNAAIIVFGKLNPIIVTLGTNFAGVAILGIYVQNAVVPNHAGLSTWGKEYWLGLPNVFWVMVIIVAVVGYLLPRTRIGRRAIAVGGNPQAAKMRGISLRKTRFGIFTAAGFLAGLAAVLFTASQSSFVSADGTDYLFLTIAATLVAGIGLSGGYGNLWVTFLSVGLLSTIPTTLAFFGVPALWQNVPAGVILVIAVAIDGFRRMRSAR
jgi:ribose/xylose/arabinose/galactoside ABC-type transport system permease subunit